MICSAAKAHVSALLVPEAGGERFIIAAGPCAGQDFADVRSAHLTPPDPFPQALYCTYVGWALSGPT